IAQPAKTKSASPADAIIAREQSLYDALTKNDYAGFNKIVGGDFIYQSVDGTIHWEITKSADQLKGCKTGKWTMSDAKVTPAGADVMVLTYTTAGEQTCDGKKSPSPIYAMSVWQKKGSDWVAVAHSETPAAKPASK